MVLYECKSKNFQVVQIKEPEGHPAHRGILRRQADFLVKIPAQAFLVRALGKGHAVAQQIVDELVHHKAEKPAGDLVVGRVHIQVRFALHVVEDFFVFVYGGVFAVVIFLRGQGGFVLAAGLVVVDRPQEEHSTPLFILAAVQKILIGFQGKF